ncbi:MAG: argininosuccinate lyase [Hyphomicrobiales bacterium]|jgi:argininosuccinate lyase
MTDQSVFPDPVYRETVLAPLFEGVKAHFAQHMSAINKAHLVMLVETAILTRAQGQHIAGALVGIDRDTDIAALTYTGEHEDYFFFVEDQLKRRLGADLGGMLHTARSRNDMDHTVFKMALRTRTDTLTAALLDLADALIEKAREERDTLIVAYTHGQPAQGSTFGHYLAAAIEVLLADIERLQAAREALDLCPMGAAAITTTGFAVSRKRIAELLGFAAPKQNSYGCIASVDYITGLYSAIKLPFLHFGRLIQDMAFWSAFEVGQLYVPNALVQISSIMPQKRNPVPIEHLRHLSSVTVGRCETMIMTMHNTPFTDMNDSEGEVQAAGFASFESAGRVTALLTAFLPACRINAEAVARNGDAACVTVTELADTLVRQEGLSFRQAHTIAAQTARAVIAEGVPLGEGFAAFRAAFARETERASSLDEAAFADAVSLQTFVARRERFGGPGPDAMDNALGGYEHSSAELRQKLEAKTAQIASADQTLTTAFNALLEIA